VPSRQFAKMPDDIEPTRASLHQYALAIGSIPRVHAEPHEKWWHVSLNLTGRGLETDSMPLPDGATFAVRLDMHSHAVVIEANGETVKSIPFGDGLTGTEMGSAVIAAVGDLGLSGEYATEKFESDEAREYDAATAAAFFEILTNIHDVYSIHRERIDASVGPLQLWPHGFDLAFEWYGTRVEEYEEHGEMKAHPSQCNFGFYPAGRPYLYANPWPFEADELLGVELPSGAVWNTEGWQGSMLHYDKLAGDEAAEQRILDYFKAVFDAAEPTLTA